MPLKVLKTDEILENTRKVLQLKAVILATGILEPLVFLTARILQGGPVKTAHFQITILVQLFKIR